MYLFNFYIDLDLKAEVEQKIIRLNGERNKGQLSALIRILLKQFAMTPDDKVNPLLIEALDAEYTYTQQKNKRSKL
jgi:hypothetical protein